MGEPHDGEVDDFDDGYDPNSEAVFDDYFDTQIADQIERDIRSDGSIPPKYLIREFLVVLCAILQRKRDIESLLTPDNEDFC